MKTNSAHIIKEGREDNRPLSPQAVSQNTRWRFHQEYRPDHYRFDQADLYQAEAAHQQQQGIGVNIEMKALTEIDEYDFVDIAGKHGNYPQRNCSGKAWASRRATRRAPITVATFIDRSLL